MRTRVTGWKLDEAIDRFLTQGVPLDKPELEGIYAKGWTEGRNIGVFVGAFGTAIGSIIVLSLIWWLK